MPEHHRLVDRLIAVCQPDDRILAVMVYGSHASGRADAYSDLDIGLITTDVGYDEVIVRRGELVRSLGEPLLLEDFGDPSNVHVILADGADLELIVARESEATLDGPYRVLLDKAGAVERVSARRKAARDPDAATEEVRLLVHGFWHDVGHVIAAIGRGQLWWAYGQLDELRSVCLNLARLQAGLTAEDEAYWKVEEAVSAELLRDLRATVTELEREPMLDAALALTRFYRELAPGLAAAHGIAYPTELDDLVSARLQALSR